MAADRPTIVFVHGAWADASGFGGVIRALGDRRFTAIGVANPLRHLTGDAAYLAALLGTISGPIVLVGHSYGGAVGCTVTGEGLDPFGGRPVPTGTAGSGDLGVGHVADERMTARAPAHAVYGQPRSRSGSPSLGSNGSMDAKPSSGALHS